MLALNGVLLDQHLQAIPTFLKEVQGAGGHLLLLFCNSWACFLFYLR